MWVKQHKQGVSMFLVAALAWQGLIACGGAGGADSGGSGKAKAGAAGKGGKGGSSGSSSQGGKGGEGGEGGEGGGGGSFPSAGGGGQGGSSAGGQSGAAGDSQGAGQGGEAGAGQGGEAGSGQAGSGGSDAGSGGDAGSGDAGSGGSAGESAGSGGSQAGSGGSSSGSGGSGPNPTCAGDPNIDNDGDGYTETDGDCNDCDVNANPGAVDIVTYNADGSVSDEQADEDCDGVTTMPGQDTCDQGLAIEDGDPLKAAFAMDICKQSQNGSWGIVKAEYIKLDGTPLSGKGSLGHGLLSKFGNATTPKRGASMFAVSSGTARNPGEPNYSSPGGFNQGTDANFPPGFPLESPDCGGVKTGAPHDSVALRLTLKVPNNAKSFSFKFKFYTFEYPGYICSQFNDFFTVLMDPPPADVNQTNKNITFDAKKNPVSVNNAFLEVCNPGTYGGKTFTCPGGTGDLAGTGFENHGATLWLQTQAPVTPGSTITLTFGAFDSGDHILDSTGLVDDFQWSAEPAQGTSTGKP